jgi:hypothetical protein
MALDFHINGVTLDHINKGDWLDEPGDAQALDGVTPLARWRRHTWRADVLTAAEWNALRVAEGGIVSIVTPAYDDRNGLDYRAYYGVIFEQMDGTHDGPIVTSVNCNFLVRV